MQKTKPLIAAGLLALGFAVAAPAIARPFAYSGDGDTTGGNLYRIDLATNAVTVVGPMPGVLLEGLSFGPGGTTLYGFDDSGSNIYSIDKNTGTPTLIGPLGTEEVDVGLAFCPDNGTMYLLGESGRLYRVNLSTGAGTLIGSGSNYGPTALSCTTSGTLYAVSDATNSLYTVNRTTGAETLVGPLGVDIADAGLGSDGSRLLMVADGAPTVLYQINTTTGAATQIAVLDAGDLSFESMAVDEEAAGGPIATAEPQSIPTLSEWGFILLSGLLALGTIVTLRRRNH
jgi:DNA-binding beta-propeller fold protein YncE